MEVDLVVGTVPFDSAEESVVRKLALDRRRSSLKKVMVFDVPGPSRRRRKIVKDRGGDAFGRSDRGRRALRGRGRSASYLPILAYSEVSKKVTRRLTDEGEGPAHSERTKGTSIK